MSCLHACGCLTVAMQTILTAVAWVARPLEGRHKACAEKNLASYASDCPWVSLFRPGCAAQATAAVCLWERH